METNNSSFPAVGILVPTLGLRMDYLLDCLESIKVAGNPYVLVIAPQKVHASLKKYEHLFDQLENDPGTGLASAINLGESKLPTHIKIFNWLGDDDQISAEGFRRSVNELTSNPATVATYGISEFIDQNGIKFGRSTLGKVAVPLLPIGPNKIPQPGALIRREAFERIGGLNNKFGWAFDYDMFIRLSKVGELSFINQVVSQYRWHPESLSASQTKSSILEASKVRRENLPACLKGLSYLWEIPHVALALALSRRMTISAQRNAQKVGPK